MSRFETSPFEMSRNDERLTLTLPMGGSLLSVGCSVLLTFLCVTVLWLIALMQELSSAGERGAAGSFPFSDLSSSLFGFLWLTGFLVLLFVVPFHVVRANRSPLIFSFDRANGLFFRNGKVITALRRIEYLRIRRISDPEGAYSYRLIVVYLDGHEIVLYDAYDESEIRCLAEEIGSFIQAPLAGVGS